MAVPVAPKGKYAALQAYRHLLRATRIAFQGDTTTFLASRSAARDGFNANRSLAPDSEKAEKAIQHATGVSTILMQNVVQGMSVGEDRWKLNIHEYTERGDNETAKSLKGSTKSFKEMKDAQF